MSDLSSRGSRWEKLRLQVLEQYEYRCAYCGKDANEVDHLIPKAQGGTDDIDNLVACCGDCNKSKGSKLYHRTAWFNPRWLEHL